MARVDAATVLRILYDRLQTVSGVTVYPMSIPPAQDLSAWARFESMSIRPTGRTETTTNLESDECLLSFKISVGCQVIEASGSHFAIGTVIENVSSAFDCWGTENSDHVVSVYLGSRSVGSDPDGQRLIVFGEIEFNGIIVRNSGTTRETYSPTA